ncbi:MAG: hypothetical protein V3R95_05680 [Dehalococcoidia bacterium]
MNAAALPYTLLILLVELAAGSIAFVVVFDARGGVSWGYVKMSGIVVLPVAALAFWTYLGLGSEQVIDGYPLSLDWLPVVGWSLVAMIALSSLHLVAAFREQRRPTLAFGAATAVAGAVTLVALSGLVAGPTWSYAGTLLSMALASVVLGGSLMAMSWGHWYLTKSGLPKEPMEQMALVVVAALLVQGVFVLLGAMLPVREPPLTDAAFGVTLGRNPAFWLRVGVGLIFPALVALLAWRAATMRGMMSATGLLYIAVGSVLAGEVLARGLLFTTAATV